MSGANVGTAYITISPKFDGLTSSVNKALSSIDLSQAGTAMGGKAANGFGSAFSKITSGALSKTGDAVSKTFNGISGLVARAGLSIGGRFGTGLLHAANGLTTLGGKIQGVFGSLSAKAASASGSSAASLESAASRGTSAFSAFSVAAVAKIATIGAAVRKVVQESVTAFDTLQTFGNTMAFAGFDSGAIADYKKGLTDYAKSTVYNLNDVMNTAAQLGANGVQNFDLITESLGNVNAASGGTATSFGLAAQQLVQMNSLGKVQYADWKVFAQDMPGAAGKIKDALANELGVSVDEVMQKISQGEVTADQFNQALIAVGQTDVAKNATGQITTFQAAVGEVMDTIGLDGAELMEKLFNTERLTAFTTFATGAIDGLFAGIESAGNVVGGLFDQLKQGFESTFDPSWAEASLSTISSSLSGVAQAAQPIMDALSNGISSAVQWLGQMAGSLANSGLNDFAVTVQNVSLSVQSALSSIDLNAIGGSISSFASGAQAVISSLLGSIDLNAISAAFSSFVQGVQTGWTALTTALSNPAVSEALSAVGGALQVVASTVGGAITTALSTLLPIVGQWLAYVGQMLGVVVTVAASFVNWAASTGVLQAVFSALVGVISAVWTAITTVASVVLTVVNAFVSWAVESGALQGVLTAIGAVFNVVGTIFTTVGGVIVGVASAIGGAISAAGSIFESIASTVTGAWEAVVSFFSGIPGSITGFFSGIGSTIGGLFNVAKDNAINAFRDLLGTVRGIPDQIVGFFTGIGGRISSAFGSIHFPQPSVEWSSIDVMGQSISLPHVTFHAAGGVFDHLSVFGEAGPEMVTPLNRRSTFPFADLIAERMNQNGGSADESAVIAWLAENLPEIISRYTPTIGGRDFRRMAKAAVNA